ncbi:hypothetical protein PAHAL_1G399300 [Panicum hallii]|uniref:Polymerase/histidinol phosphatase N-terminal domain-containing protein n=1 Tax=Panicum hallii TaxID=206008 RepID=A0A2S3GTR3_9POAL|nr:hypothetical protein PAHAL_1G399300 [Panicum hallii]
MPPPAGASTEEDAVVVVAADAIATSAAPNAGDPEPQPDKGRRRRKKRRRPRAPTEEELAARRSLLRWACPGREVASDDGQAAEAGRARLRRPRVAVELHAHSACSDGTLSPAELVERAHRNGVKVFALTDHDTMAGVPEAVEAAKRHPVRIIPGVEISAVHSPRGSEPTAESVVQLVCRTGGVAVLAHPWALKNPGAVIKNLKAAGLHGIEVYRSDGKVSGLSDLADTYELLKLGGSDFHGRDDKEEPDVGSVDLPVLAVFKFLEIAKPIWHNAIREIFASISERTTDLNGSNGFQRISSAGDFCIPRHSSEDPELTSVSEVEVLRTEVTDIVLTHQ